MRTLYVDLLSGAAGDMLLASLIDLGFPVSLLEEHLAGLPIEHIHLQVEKAVRNGISATLFTPHCGHSHEHRHLKDILAILQKGSVAPALYERCKKVLDRLADAEAKVHGISRDHVHFHEIGALDTIVDILGFCVALDYFKIDRLQFSTLTDGHGTVNVAHGVMPVPVPATAVMIEGLRLRTLPVATELLTPTGAALLTALGEQVEAGSGGTVVGIGYGCGSKVFENHPNFLRIVLFETEDRSEDGYADQVIVCESDLDHVSGEIMGDVAGRLFDAGALDVCWIPVYMKKGRPGYRLSVTAPLELSQKMADMIIRQTRTLGVRMQKIDRVTAGRSITTTTIGDAEYMEKQCVYKGYSFSKPEYESLAALSRKKGCSVIDIMEEYLRNRQ